MSTMSSQQRHPNFRLEDLEILVEKMAEHKQVLFGKFSNSVTADSKVKIWEKITSQINASNNNAVRTGEEVKKKWSDWASTTKMKNAKRKVSRRMTGGGVGMPDATETELKVLSIIGQGATDGFGGWIDTETMSMIGLLSVPSSGSLAPPVPSPAEDNPTESHQEVPVGATLDDRPTSATSRHVTIVPTAVPSTSNYRPSASFVPPSLSTPRAPKRRAAPAEGRWCLHYIL